MRALLGIHQYDHRSKEAWRNRCDRWSMLQQNTSSSSASFQHENHAYYSNDGNDDHHYGHQGTVWTSNDVGGGHGNIAWCPCHESPTIEDQPEGCEALASVASFSSFDSKKLFFIGSFLLAVCFAAWTAGRLRKQRLEWLSATMVDPDDPERGLGGRRTSADASRATDESTRGGGGGGGGVRIAEGAARVWGGAGNAGDDWIREIDKKVLAPKPQKFFEVVNPAGDVVIGQFVKIVDVDAFTPDSSVHVMTTGASGSGRERYSDCYDIRRGRRSENGDDWGGGRVLVLGGVVEPAADAAVTAGTLHRGGNRGDGAPAISIGRASGGVSSRHSMRDGLRSENEEASGEDEAGIDEGGVVEDSASEQTGTRDAGSLDPFSDSPLEENDAELDAENAAAGTTNRAGSAFREHHFSGNTRDDVPSTSPGGDSPWADDVSPQRFSHDSDGSAREAMALVSAEEQALEFAYEMASYERDMMLGSVTSAPSASGRPSGESAGELDASASSSSASSSTSSVTQSHRHTARGERSN